MGRSINCKYRSSPLFEKQHLHSPAWSEASSGKYLRIDEESCGCCRPFRGCVARAPCDTPVHFDLPGKSKCRCRCCEGCWSRHKHRDPARSNLEFCEGIASRRLAMTAINLSPLRPGNAGYPYSRNTFSPRSPHLGGFAEPSSGRRQGTSEQNQIYRSHAARQCLSLSREPV